MHAMKGIGVHTFLIVQILVHSHFDLVIWFLTLEAIEPLYFHLRKQMIVHNPVF